MKNLVFSENVGTNSKVALGPSLKSNLNVVNVSNTIKGGVINNFISRVPHLEMQL